MHVLSFGSQFEIFFMFCFRQILRESSSC